MASFAKIGLNGKVIEVLSVVNEVLHDSNKIEQEAIGIDFLTKLTGYPVWVQTSYNTNGGIHNKGETPLRKNFAGIGYTYDEDRDAFIPKKPYNSWVLNEQTCLWEAPIAYPITYINNLIYINNIKNEEGQKIEEEQKIQDKYIWNEEILNWTLQNI